MQSVQGQRILRSAALRIRLRNRDSDRIVFISSGSVIDANVTRPLGTARPGPRPLRGARSVLRRAKRLGLLIRPKIAYRAGEDSEASARWHSAAGR
jgi:hypothetical protein